MSFALVVLNDVPQMHLCSVCAKPGACCSNFVLSSNSFDGVFWLDEWPVEAQRMLHERGLPFVPLHVSGIMFDAAGRGYGYGRFGCDKLLPSGLCGIYDTRPYVCSSFVPASNRLCIYG